MGAVKNKSELSSRQQALRKKHNMTEEGFREMLKVLNSLTPAERATLEDPDFVTEDEDDIIYCERHKDDPTVSLEDVMAEFGYTPRNRRSA